MIKRIAVLGSTGTIGDNTLRIAERFPKRFRVVALSAFNNVRKLEHQIRRFAPRHIAVKASFIERLKAERPSVRRPRIWDAETSTERLAALPEVDTVIIGIRGAAALRPFLSAVKSGKTVAPANKEALVMAGQVIMREAKRHKAIIVPVDSEQSAVFQCLQGQRRADLRKIILTASGGALFHVNKRQFGRLTKQQVLSHPRWRMGEKITVDSATMMNKGLEVIEASWLFDVPVEQIDIVIHPEAIIHSMVEFKDGCVLAQMGVTDMRLPIQYAMTYPQRWETGLPPLDFAQLGRFTFLKPDQKKFPALGLCFWVAKRRGTYPSVLNAANEVAVEAFLKDKIKFSSIIAIVEKVIERHRNKKEPDLSDLCQADQWGRREARRLIGS